MGNSLHFQSTTVAAEAGGSPFTAERVGLEGRCPPGTRVFWGASQRRQPKSRCGPEWPRRWRRSVVPGGHLAPAPPAQVTHRKSALDYRKIGREVVGGTWRAGLEGRCPPGTRIFWGASQRRKPKSRGGPEWSRGRDSAWSRKGTSPPAPPAQVTHRRATRYAGGIWVVRSLARRGGRGWGEVPSRDPYLLESFSARETTISWRARVATPIATQRGPGRAPPPNPARESYANAARD